MKNLMTIAAAFAMAASVNAQETVTVPFTATRVSVPAKINFVIGDNYGVSVEAKDVKAASSLQCSVKDGILYIGKDKASKSGKFGNFEDTYNYEIKAKEADTKDNDLVITVSAPAMPEFMVSRDFEMNLVKYAKSDSELARSEK